MLNIRLNIAFVVLIINKYTFNLINAYYKIVKQIFYYLRNIFDLCFIFGKNNCFLLDYIDIN